jgi:hypothetical protein
MCWRREIVVNRGNAPDEDTKSTNTDRVASRTLPASASITVAVCTYDRPNMLRGLLTKLLNGQHGISPDDYLVWPAPLNRLFRNQRLGGHTDQQVGAVEPADIFQTLGNIREDAQRGGGRGWD